MMYLEAKNGKIYRENKPYLLEGFGLGGWLLPEGYMWGLYDKCDRPWRMEKMLEILCGPDYANHFWNNYYDSYITKEDIKLIADSGFNSVRLPLNARHLYFYEGDKISFNLKTIAYVDQLIKWCKGLDLYVILDMHGAPGGQTGTNIDDSLDDEPRLFIEAHYEHELVELWAMLATRYKDEPTVAGYDLLNEPLPNWFSKYNHKLMPLYKRIIHKIRSIDTKHMIILEGLHWATDFSVFDQISSEEASNGIVLEFHKYWSNPDKESLEPFIEASKRLNVPLFMGEGGENNLEWYTAIFPLYERLDISWSFWSYKKMSCENSPVSFDKPRDWERIVTWAEENEDYLQNAGKVKSPGITDLEAQTIFDNFLFNISHSKVNAGVFNALKRIAPIILPAESYDAYGVEDGKIRSTGADFRLTDPINILFESGKTGEVDYKRYDGAMQPQEENLVVELLENETLTYNFGTEDDDVEIVIKFATNCKIDVEKENVMTCTIDGQMINCTSNEKDKYKFTFKRKLFDSKDKKNFSCHQLTIKCESGILFLDHIELKRGE